MISLGACGCGGLGLGLAMGPGQRPKIPVVVVVVPYAVGWVGCVAGGSVSGGWGPVLARWGIKSEVLS